MRARYGSKRHIGPRDRVAMQQSHPRPRAADRALLDPALAAPQQAIFFVPPAKGSVKVRSGPMYGAAALGRQPRRQRRVARLWAPRQCGRKAAHVRESVHIASRSPGPLEGA